MYSLFPLLTCSSSYLTRLCSPLRAQAVDKQTNGNDELGERLCALRSGIFRFWLLVGLNRPDWAENVERMYSMGVESNFFFFFF